MKKVSCILLTFRGLNNISQFSVETKISFEFGKIISFEQGNEIIDFVKLVVKVRDLSPKSCF